MKWQSISAGSGPQKGNTLPVVWIFCNVFSRKRTERGFHWHGRHGATLWGPERVTELHVCLRTYSPKMQCYGILPWVWFHLLSVFFLILSYSLIPKEQSWLLSVLPALDVTSPTPQKGVYAAAPRHRRSLQAGSTGRDLPLLHQPQELQHGDLPN